VSVAIEPGNPPRARWRGPYASGVLYGRVGLSPVMIGRAAELDRLTRLMAVGPGRTPAVALIGGEAGIGKTRLVRELCDRVPQGVPVLAGQAEPGALGRPFELLLDALDGLDVDPEALAVVADRSKPLDERVLVGLEAVRRIAVGGRAVVVFEDLHWADSESITLFERLAEPDCGPLVLIGTYRPDAVNRRHPVSELLPRLERRHSVTHLRLDRLSQLDVGAFLGAVYGGSPSYRVVESLHARTGGNPFFLEELLGAAGTELDPECLADQPLPWSLAELVRGQLEELEPAERRVLETAAVLGRRIHFDVLAAVTLTTEDELIDHLRSLVGRGLLIEQEEDVFAFRHALAREAVGDDLLGREKRRINRLALEALQVSDSCDLAAIAHHAEAAGDEEVLVDAARRGSHDYLDQGSTFQALQLAELGLSVADDDPKLLAVAARAAWLAGLIDDAFAHNAHRLEVAEADDDLEAVSAVRRLHVRLAWERGDTPEMVRSTAALEALVEQLPDGHERGMALAVLAQSTMLRDDITQAVRWADAALDLADRLGDPAVEAHASVEKGSALVMVPGRFDEGADLLRNAADVAERLGDHVVVARALHNLVRTDTRPRDAAESRRQLERMRVAAERVGFDSMAGSAHAQGLADLAEWEGDIGAAQAALEDGRRLDRGYLLTHKGSWFSVHEAGLALEAGDVERARLIAKDLQSLPGKPTWFMGLWCHVLFRLGRIEEGLEAVADLCAFADTGRHPGEKGWLSGGTVHSVVSAALRAGVPPEQLHGIAERIATQPKGFTAIPEDEAHAIRALVDGQLAEAEGRIEEALAAYQQAAVAEESLYPYERGTAFVGAARCLIHLGRLDEAKSEAKEADALLERWAGWRVEELEAVRRRVGLGGPVAGPEALTPREREVVALLTEGLSNAELAGRLFISPKTAAVHVSNVLAKLGMASRTEVAAWAIREGVGA
jgi:DNA-binding CsgD family transcriptional regulator